MTVVAWWGKWAGGMVLAVAAVLAVLAPRAAADTHYFDAAVLDSTSAYGFTLNLWEDCLGVSNVQTDFVDNEAWQFTNGGVGYWVEAGDTIGVGGPTGYLNVPTFFIAVESPNHGYNQWFATYGPSQDQWYGEKISYNGSGSWTANVDGFTHTTDADQPNPDEALAGLEWRGPDPTAYNYWDYGQQGNLEELNSSDQPIGDWSGATLQQLNGSGSPTSGLPSQHKWQSQYVTAEEELYANDYPSECTGYPKDWVGDPAPPAATPADVNSPAWQRQEIEKAAAGMGDPSPTNIRTAKTTYGAAVAELSGGSIGQQFANIPIALLAAQGRFVDRTASQPPGDAPPSGRNLSMLWDADTGQFLGLAVSDHTPDVAALAGDSSPRTARIVGSVRHAGPGENIKRPGTVILHNGSHRAIARQHVQTGHRFNFAVYPGTYYLSVARWGSRCWLASKPNEPAQEAPIRAKARSTSHVTIYCPVR